MTTTNAPDTWQNREGAPKTSSEAYNPILDNGDPTMYEPFWRSIGDKCTLVFKGYESLSYFSNPKNPCWFLEPKLEESIKSLHGVVGNAVTDGYSIVVGTGSSQLLQAVLYAVTSHDQANPINVVAAAPYYSSYPEIMDLVKSGLYKWGGDAHAWALVKDKEVAKKMTKYMEVTTIGVSKESQLRVAKILQVVADGCKCFGSPDGDNFFEFGQKMMAKRWEILRETVKKTQMFTLPKFPHQHCTYFGDVTQAYPAFAWIKCKEGNEDCEKLFRGYNILTRGGSRFGSDPSFVRVSMMSKDEEFNLFIDRLSMIQSFNDGNGNGSGYETRNGNGNGNLRGRLVRGYRFEAMTIILIAVVWLVGLVMTISVILISSDSSEGSVGTPAGRVILFETPIIAPTVPPSLDYTPASPDYSPASDSESDLSEDPSSDHIPPLPATSPFLSSDDDTIDSDSPDTPPSPTHGTPFTEITSSTQRSPVIPRRRVMILAHGQPIPHGRPYRYHLNGPIHKMTARKRVGPLPTHRLAMRHSADHSSLDSSSEASSDFHSDASSDSSSRHSLSDHSSPKLRSVNPR
ncbi:L-tryptophan--pyruvate aminotransferase 1-like protein [Tanacetum coccineum]|uniref:L-tryptophan--pyruvate aminotransferase 1-like protein n=1 Tax=Tanacetum coccineum TaxID=301880 RepID=A0ABQ5E5Q8_9ASTR